jgi:hypothetical protein
MAANEETRAILQRFVLPGFDRAIREAAAAMDASERILCAGLVATVSTETESPAAEKPSPYYVVTTAGLYYGIVKKKAVRLSDPVGENRFVPRAEIFTYETDDQAAIDLRATDGQLLAGLIFGDSLGPQLVRSAGDGSPMRQQDLTAIQQLDNVIRALGLPPRHPSA